MTKSLQVRKRSRKHRLLVTLFLIAGSFVLTHIPQDEMPRMLDLWSMDKILHFFAYWIITSSLLMSLRPKSGTLITMAAILGIALLAGFDEYTQQFVGRSCSLYDWLADMAGTVTALLLFLIVKAIKNKTPLQPAVDKKGLKLAAEKG